MLNSSVNREVPVVLSLAALAAAQRTRSVIQGRVPELQNSVIAGATVRGANLDTNPSISAFNEAYLRVAHKYQVSLQASGFKGSISCRSRDCVIDAFKADKSDDPFSRCRIGGHELWPRDPPARIGTGGFNRSYADERQKAFYEILRRPVVRKGISGRRPLTYRGFQ
jgi:hypothetical protein